MAAVLQAGINMLRDRLGRHLDTARQIDFSVSNKLNPESKNKKIEELINKTENIKKKIVGVIEEINKKDMDYANFIKYLDIEARENENEQYREFALGPNGFLTILDEARDVLDILDENYDTLNRVEGPRERNRATLNETILQMPNTIRLPEIRLPSFSGKLEEYRPFMEEFKCAVDEQAISDKRKLQYLFGALNGEPKEMARQYPLEGQNYKIVLELLEKNFGDKSNIKSALHANLRRIPRASKYVPEIRQTLRKVEAIINQLNNLGEYTNNEQLILEIESKLPKWLLTEIYKKKRNNIEWSVKKMLEFLDNSLKLEEDVFRAHKNFEQEKTDTLPNFRQNLKHNNFQYKNNGRNFQMNYNNKRNNFGNKGTGMFAITEKKFLHTCRFCEENHWENNCSKYLSPEKRLERAKELKLCFKCLKNNHRQS
uniref:Uncharacterized protein n=1 Tax=Meloidogyne incognita TaxID=6306 RepID=A0A914MQE2_MELIC